MFENEGLLFTKNKTVDEPDSVGTIAALRSYDTFARLPTGQARGDRALVLNTTGAIFLRKKKGVYRFNGTNWIIEPDLKLYDNTVTIAKLTPSLRSTINDNANKTGITPAQVVAINTNSTKRGISNSQIAAINLNTNKIGIRNNQSAAIVSNTAKVGLSASQILEIAKVMTKQNQIIAGENITLTGNTLDVQIPTTPSGNNSNRQAVLQFADGFVQKRTSAGVSFIVNQLGLTNIGGAFSDRLTLVYT